MLTTKGSQHTVKWYIDKSNANSFSILFQQTTMILRMVITVQNQTLSYIHIIYSLTMYKRNMWHRLIFSSDISGNAMNIMKHRLWT